MLATDLLQVNFNVLMKIDGFLSDPSNYTLLDNFSVPMGIRKVVVPIGGTAIFVLLYTDKVVQSLLYTLDILNLRTTKGDTVDLLNSKIEFAGAYTKLDSSRSIQQKMYTKDAGSMLTSLMAAITSEDNKIGG
ncbi:MAG: hypothetical protein L3J47_00370 [Sulfurovum sp.]|nr:hypothetical protein [Sulfurovum sp.]